MRRGLAATAALTMFVALPAGAGAETFDVTRKGDPAPGDCRANDCSLREAVLAANARAGADRIVLPSRKGAYKLSIPSTGEDGALDGDLDVTNDRLTLLHPGKGLATVDANGIDRAFNTFQGAPFKVVKLEIRGGDNPTGFDGSGGGILATEDVTLIRSKLARNSADDDGGGISVDEDSGASLTIKRSTVTRNVTDDDGGGVALEEDSDGESTGDLLISRSKITRNRALTNFGGGIFVQRPSKIVETTIDRNRADNAAGIGVEDNATVVKDTAVTRNTTTGSEGGGLELAGPGARLVNVTVAGNSAENEGGGIAVYSSEPVQLNSVTVVGNVANSAENSGEGGGIMVGTNETVTLSNSLVADNRLGGGEPDNCSGDPIQSGGHNLADRQAASCGLESSKKDLLNRPPGIGKLGRHGGPTETVPLKPRSKAVGKAGADSPPRDQRGVRRKNPDIGAFELR